MSDDEPVDKFILCDCFGEGIRITYWPDDKLFYMSMWKQKGNGVVPFRQRFRHMWRILTRGYPWADEIILNHSEAYRLGRYLLNPKGKP